VISVIIHIIYIDCHVSAVDAESRNDERIPYTRFHQGFVFRVSLVKTGFPLAGDLTDKREYRVRRMCVYDYNGFSLSLYPSSVSSACVL
jgi:hypothetical protein